VGLLIFFFSCFCFVYKRLFFFVSTTHHAHLNYWDKAIRSIYPESFLPQSCEYFRHTTRRDIGILEMFFVLVASRLPSHSRDRYKLKPLTKQMQKSCLVMYILHSILLNMVRSLLLSIYVPFASRKCAVQPKSSSLQSS
jgi:hypothetical protein